METSYHTSVKELPESERPRERLERDGANALKSTELLAIALRTGSQRLNALALAERLIADFGGLGGLGRASIRELCQVDGIGPAKAAQVLAALELGRRLASAAEEARPRITSPEDAAREFINRMGRPDQEELHVMLLDTRGQMQRIALVYRGNVNSSMVRMAELFRPAIRDNAPSVILAHNHPSGDVSPSPDDIEMTRDAVRSGALLDIQVLDHLILGHGTHLSMKSQGLGF